MQFGSPTSLMSTRLLLALVGALLIVRLPSLAQPMGPDQGLYAYVGERILHGELAYRDAWDQKPPGIHYVYAALRAVSSRDVVVPAADLVAAALVAALLWVIGTRLGGPVAGGVSAAVFLLLSDPSFARYGGVRVRAQAETFIALAVTGALALALGAKGPKGAVRLGVAGLLVGAAFALKYNAGLYVLVVLLALVVTSGMTLLDVVWIAAGSLIVPLVLFAVFWRGGALHRSVSGDDRLQPALLRRDLREPLGHGAVSGHVPDPARAGRRAVVRRRARLRRPARRGPAQARGPCLWLPVAWVAAACVSIAINGSRNLPQYFLQAAPALALAAGLAGTVALTPLPKAARWLIVAVIAVFVWRAGDDPFPKLAGNVWHDTQYVTGRIDRRTHLAQYGGARDSDKYSALDNMDIGGVPRGAGRRPTRPSTSSASHRRPTSTPIAGARRGFSGAAR